MQLDPVVRDYKAYMDELADALKSGDTHLYLDTSLLMWLTRIAAGARDEFIAWCRSRRTGTVWVPVWAAHELHRHIQSKSETTSVKKALAQGLAGKAELFRVAMERADEARCLASGYTSRDAYLAEIESASAHLEKLVTVIEFTERDFEESTEFVVAFANERLLDSDLDPIIEKLSSQAQFRKLHRIPPGFEDNKPENRSGDVVIWEEIVRHLNTVGPGAGGEPRCAIFVSRDEKHDWISKALWVRNSGGKPSPANVKLGLDVRRPHPLLVHELALRAPQSRIYIVSPKFLATNLAYAADRDGGRNSTPQLMDVTYPRGVLNQLFWTRLRAADANQQATFAAQVTRAASTHVAVQPSPAIRLGLRDIVGPAKPEELDKLVSAPVHEQPGVLATWGAELVAGEKDPIIIGRLLAAAMSEEGPAMTGSIPRLIAEIGGHLDEVALNKLVVAVAAAAYFDRYGKLRPRPDRALGRVALELEKDPRLADAFATLKRLLTEAGAKLPYMPGTMRGELLSLELSVSKGLKGAAARIHDIRIGTHPVLLGSSEGSSRRLSKLLNRDPAGACTGLELRTLLAREYLIPMEVLTDRYDQQTLTWMPEAALAAMNTESEGGLAPFADEGDEND